MIHSEQSLNFLFKIEYYVLSTDLLSILDDTAFRAGTFSWQDPVYYWKAGPSEVMTVEFFFITFNIQQREELIGQSIGMSMFPSSQSLILLFNDFMKNNFITQPTFQ